MRARIQGTITRADTPEAQFLITSEGSVLWGASPRELGEVREVLDVMTSAALYATDFFAEPEPEEGQPVTVTPEQIKEFTDAIREASKAADGDSNDDEIEALWEVVDHACNALGLNRDDFVQ